jgi:myo-inositol-1-phosphate synthase
MAISKSYEVGDSVYVWYQDSVDDFFTPIERIVAQVRITGDDNTAVVSFESGRDVVDSDILQTVFTTQGACATSIINDVITRSAATVLLDSTLSDSSTAGNPTVSLGRLDV